MKTKLISCLLLLSACKMSITEKPLYVNAPDTIILPGKKVEFLTAVKEWKATLITATQPIRLTTTYNNGKLSGILLHNKGITEGPAEICLEHEDQYFFYPIYILNNDTTAFISKDYRSPKTVNPDSSLHQQRILHCYDVYRNILPRQTNHKYFYEVDISLLPKVGVYRAIQKESLSSFYVQAGSCIKIQIKSSYKKELGGYYVSTGLLKDKDNNTVAEGTLVVFIYNDEEQSYRMEAPLVHGMVSVTIPSLPTKHYTIKAKINDTESNQINLIP